MVAQYETRVAVREAEPSELSEVIAVQHQAFGRVATALGIDPEALPPLHEDVPCLERSILDGCTVLVALWDDMVVGSVRVQLREGCVTEIGRLVVRTGWERRGIGTALMCAIEEHFDHTGTYRLFTGADAADTQAFYGRRGYRLEGRHDTGAYGLVWMTKPGPSGFPSDSKPVS